MSTHQRTHIFNDSDTRVYEGQYLHCMPCLKEDGYAPISVRGVIQRLRDTVACNPSESLGDHIDMDTGDVLVLYNGRVKFDTDSSLLHTLKRDQIRLDRSGTLDASLWDTIDSPELSIEAFHNANGKPLTRSALYENRIWNALIPEKTFYGNFDVLFAHGNRLSKAERKNFSFQLSLPSALDVPTFRPLRVTYNKGIVSITNYMGLNNSTTRIVGIPASQVPVREIPLDLEEDTDNVLELPSDAIVPVDPDESFVAPSRARD